MDGSRRGQPDRGPLSVEPRSRCRLSGDYSLHVIYRFGDFTLDGDTRQLLSKNSEVHLSPKAFELLSMLVANRGRAVAKAELQEHLWPSTFVEETNLASLVVEIRRALRDKASDPAFIKTVYSFGYRFAGTVKIDTVAAGTGTGSVKPCLVLDDREILLIEGANIIGRDADATIQIDSPGVSRHHARVLISRGEATLEDLGSKNGTRVNGTPVTTPARLSDGDAIKLGAVTMTFRIATSTSLTETLPGGSG